MLELALRMKGLQAEETPREEVQVDSSSSSAQTELDEEIRRLRYGMVPTKKTKNVSTIIYLSVTLVHFPADSVLSADFLIFFFQEEIRRKKPEALLGGVIHL